MKTAAVIAEFNPLHNGHEYFLNEIRRRSECDYLVCVMSGDFVQRGEPAILDKYERTRLALRAGCDLVLELPVRYSTGSAPVFAGGAVSILNSLGCIDELWFGSESGDINDFEELSTAFADESSDLYALIREFIRKGNSYPKSRAMAVNRLYGSRFDQLLSEPNNILGLEYCTALKKVDSRVRPHCLKRAGQGYNDSSSTDSAEFPSAASIRNIIRTDAASVPEPRFTDAALSLPEPVRTPISGIPAYVRYAMEKNRGAKLFLNDLSGLLCYKLLCENAETLVQYDDVTPDLAKRIVSVCRPGLSFTSQIEALKVKNITYSHISRALLHILLNLKGNTPPLFDPSYIRILGMKDCGDLLHKIKTSGNKNLLTAKPSSLKTEAGDPYADDLFASNLYEAIKCERSGHEFIHEYSKPSPVKL